MKRFAAVALLLLALGLWPARPAGAEMPFGPGEKLSYDLYWTFIKAGSATLETLESGPVEGRPALHFRALAQSTPFVDTFYKVRDSIESWVDPGVTHALLYRKDQSEGSYVRHYLVRFDKNGNVAYRYSHGELKNAVIIPQGTFDPLSMLFFFRTRALFAGMEFAAPVTDGEKSITGTARVVRRETIKTKAGAFDTLLVEPDVRNIGGVFRKSPDATLQVWITNDARRIPVRVRSKVVVGHFSMELTGYQPQKKK
ncbi:MAG: hypothetical protein AUJ49_01480 [Desulfovibrionaceae bacterium CG1_02_65_16]|nr:MAG: hypothetical protein AUJ49_01480 [Desulfovibrionaceae bacterium CG1_02_65_16]